MFTKLFAVFSSSAIAITLAAWTSPSLADPGQGAYPLCYVWANSPTSSSYKPSATYSYNTVAKSAGITIDRSAVGTYAVKCKGVGGGPILAGYGSWGAGGHVQVTAYGGNSNYCKVVSWATGGPDFIGNVRCWTHDGAAADTQFDLLFVR